MTTVDVYGFVNPDHKCDGDCEDCEDIVTVNHGTHDEYCCPKTGEVQAVG